MYTVQQLLNKAVKLIDDYPNILTYGTEYLDDVIAIHTELVRKNIGIYMGKAKIFTALADQLQISDDAVDTVAALGVAARLASYNKPDYVDRLTARYEKAKRSWSSRPDGTGLMQDYYGGFYGQM